MNWTNCSCADNRPVSAATDKPLAICLMGPTAAGKTRLAMALADARDSHLISVDSTQVYRGMDIGSGKPDPLQQQRYPHALIDIRDPARPYSASEFCRDALEQIRVAADRGRLPVLVGGTMLYFKTLRDGLADMPAATPQLRADIAQLAAVDGWPAVHRQLAEVDPAAAARIHPHDPQRLQRALEVYLLTGESLSAHHRREKMAAPQRQRELPCRFCWFAIQPRQRSVLHARISRRFQRMLDAGLLDEVRSLYRRRDLGPHLPAIKAVGYRQVWQYLAGELDHDAMVQRSIIATRQLAKRQLTWLRSWPAIRPLGESITDAVRCILNYLDANAI